MEEYQAVQSAFVEREWNCILRRKNTRLLNGPISAPAKPGLLAALWIEYFFFSLSPSDLSD